METSKKSIRISGITFLVLSAVATFFFLLLIVFAPAVQEIYADFDASLPVVTRLILDVSSLFTGYWFILTPAVFIIIVLISLLAGFLLRNVENKVVIITLLVGGVLLFISFVSFMCVVVYMPLRGLAAVTG